MKAVRYSDLVIIVILALLSIWSVRPLVEEWGFIAAFRAQGLGYLGQMWSLIALRPLHIIPPALQWLIGQGHPLGYGVVAGLLIVGRYLVSYWAVSGLLSPRDRTVFATLASVLVGWEGQWLSRFNPAQLSSVLFFVALGLCLRMTRKPVWQMLLTALCIVAMLMTYQALALVALAVPVVVFVTIKAEGFKGKFVIARRGAISIALGFALYFAYAKFFASGTGSAYEEVIAGSLIGGNVLHEAASFILGAYHSAYGENVLLLPIFVAIGAICFALTEGSQRSRVVTGLVMLAGVAVLPLASLVYLNQLHLNDPQRVLFPTGVAFSLLAFIGLVRSGGNVASEAGKQAVVLGLLCAAGLYAFDARKEWNLQTSVLSQLQTIAVSTGASDIVVVDNTGRLGDVYSFLPGILISALHSVGSNISAEICTPLGVDRLHGVARRYPIPTTPRCEDLDYGTRLVVEANSSRDGIVLSAK